MPIITIAAFMFLYFGNFNLKTFSTCSYFKFTYSISPKYYLQLKCYPAAALGIGSELPLMWVWRSGVMGFTVHHGRGGAPGVPVSPGPFVILFSSKQPIIATKPKCYALYFKYTRRKLRTLNFHSGSASPGFLQTPKRNK